MKIDFGKSNFMILVLTIFFSGCANTGANQTGNVLFSMLTGVPTPGTMEYFRQERLKAEQARLDLETAQLIREKQILSQMPLSRAKKEELELRSKLGLPVNDYKYKVDCDGTNDETSASVSGECEDGSFSGTDDDTGNSVSGDCEFDGDLDATDDETGEHVSGDCDGE